MGAKITIDSSTLMNKGLEVIEAHELFGIDYDRVQVVVHPQSVVHGMVEFCDGAVLAQLSMPDMRLPIGLALGAPDRLHVRFGAIDWTGMGDLTFEEPDRDIETVVLRYFNVFGPRQDPNSQYSAVIPKFIKLMSNNQQPTIYGDGTQSRDFTYVANVVEANILAATKEVKTGLVMNCACHGQVTLNSLIRELNKLLNKEIKPIYGERKPGDIKHSFANIDLIVKKLNYKQLVLFSDGLKRTLEYYRNVQRVK